MVKPLCIDLFAGLGGWAEGFLCTRLLRKAQNVSYNVRHE